MSLPALTLLTNEQTDVRHAVRRLRWFRRAFQEQVASVSQQTGTHFEIDTSRLADGFFSWVQEFERLKPASAGDRRRFVDFAAGLLLQRLLTLQPLKAEASSAGSEDAIPAEFWPEGYACLAFCLNVRHAVLRQDFQEDAQVSEKLEDLRTWWSFRENTAEAPDSAIAFFRLFAGADPEWEAPALFRVEGPPEDRHAKPRLRLVGGSDILSDAAPRLPAGLTRAAFDLATLTNLDELLRAEVAATLRLCGLPAAPEDVDAFHRAPLGVLMTHIALRSGRICPDSFARAFHQRLRERLRDSLALQPAAEQALAALSQTGVAINLLLQNPKLTLADMPDLLLPPALADHALIVDPATESASGESSDLEQFPRRSTGEILLFISADESRLERARNLGFKVLGIGEAALASGFPGVRNIRDFPTLSA